MVVVGFRMVGVEIGVVEEGREGMFDGLSSPGEG
jgi:hypothetical protein